MAPLQQIPNKLKVCIYGIVFFRKPVPWLNKWGSLQRLLYNLLSCQATPFLLFKLGYQVASWVKQLNNWRSVKQFSSWRYKPFLDLQLLSPKDSPFTKREQYSFLCSSMWILSSLPNILPYFHILVGICMSLHFLIIVTIVNK